MMLVCTLAFATVEGNSNIDTINTIEINNSIVKTTVSIVDDICTVTVTIYYSNGTSSSGTATDHTGDCDAAREEARALARILTPRETISDI